MKPRSIRCLKFFLTLFNIMCIFFSLVLMTICVINMRDRKAHPEQQSTLSRGVLSFLLTLSLGLVLSAILGCIGSLRENVKILYVFTGFFIFLVSVEAVATVGSAVLNTWAGGGSELRVHFYKNSTVEDESSHAFWDYLQSENQCCGVDGPQDYAVLNREIPSSCCSRAHPLREGGARRHHHASCLSTKSYYMAGCEETLLQKKSFKGKMFITAGVFFLLLEEKHTIDDNTTRVSPLHEASSGDIDSTAADRLGKIMCIILAIWMARKIRSERRRLQQNLQAHFET